jgi:hypothetical protein
MTDAAQVPSAKLPARLLVVGLLWLELCASAFGQDLNTSSSGDGDDSAKTNSGLPTTYLDLRTNYARVPSGSLPIGFGSGVFTALHTFALTSAGSAAISVPLASRQGVGLDVPFTVDVTDQVSLYGGLTGSAIGVDGSGWSTFSVSSWNVGFQADVYQQNGGSIPTVTWQSTITQAVPNGPTASTTFNNIFEFDYAFDKDETKGVLAGFQDTRTILATTLASIRPNLIGYVGAYYQWPNNWKFTVRGGVQSFGGAQLLNVTPVSSFTQPIVRLDLDRMDDNDNRLFGVTAQIMWVPKPAYQLTLRTPLFFVRN